MSTLPHLTRPNLLLIDDDTCLLTALKANLTAYFNVTACTTVEDGLHHLKQHKIDFLLLDISIGKDSGLSQIQKIKTICPETDVIMMTGHKDPRLMIDAIREGASDYLVKPFATDELIAIIEKMAPLRKMRDRHAAFVQEANGALGERLILGQSQTLLDQLACAAKLRGQSANIIIEGESGTGKELFARYIHQQEQQPDRPFVAINCAAIPENLLESELFGHEAGSFTGASARKIGKFELADGGDIFLDEITSLKLDLQAKILRAIQEQEMMRVGGTKAIKVRFRVIAAANEPLETLVEQGKFRRDLFHRLRVICLVIPPLRERRDDIPILAQAFLRKYATDKSMAFNGSAMMALQQYFWPGNVRELENLVHSLTILGNGPTLTISDLPKWIFSRQAEPQVQTSTDFLSLKEYISIAEKAYVQRALTAMSGNKEKTAAVLQVSRTRLYDRLKNWGED